MSGALRPDEKPPIIDIWKPLVELDQRHFQKPPIEKFGQLFLKDDRTLASQ
jgi:hypothetical protein